MRCNIWHIVVFVNITVKGSDLHKISCVVKIRIEFDIIEKVRDLWFKDDKTKRWQLKRDSKNEAGKLIIAKEDKLQLRKLQEF